MDFLKNVSINLRATGPSAVLIAWILGITLLGIFGNKDIAILGITALMIFGGLLISVLGQKT